MNRFIVLPTSFLLILLLACKTSQDPLINIDEVSPWCIKGFDVLDRSPEERINMLNDFGFKKYGYNRGSGNFTEMISEFSLAKESDIEITSIFLWLNAKRDSLGNLSEANQELLNNLKEVERKPAIWVSLSDNYFKDRSKAESIKLAVNMVQYIKSIADDIGCPLAIYNHHGWFGNPYNQIEVIKELNQDSITMVYNFHHAHEYAEDFEEIAKMIRPHLSYVNLNGVNKEGPQILPIGEGDYEYKMIKSLKDEGYNGPWGILGHIKTEDVKVVLERNIAGLKTLNALHSESED